MTSEQFEAAEAAGEFLESAVVHGNRYGTPRTPVEQALAEGRHVILEIDVQGARSVKQARPDAVAVFIEPPSWEVLEVRLTGRGTDDPEVVRRRLRNAREELDAAAEFDERVVNDVLEDAIGQVDRILLRTP